MAPPAARALRFLWYYEALAREIIVTFKYRPSRVLACEAARMMERALPTLFSSYDWDIITTIPPSPRALAERFFAPTDLLARHVARGVQTAGRNIPISDTLRWTRDPRAQASLPRHRRLHNIRAAFAPSIALAGERVLLIDDVITTGATLSEATTTLLSAGASAIDWLALSRLRSPLQISPT